MLNFCDFIPVFVFTTITTLNYMRNFGFFFFFQTIKLRFSCMMTMLSVTDRNDIHRDNST